MQGEIRKKMHIFQFSSYNFFLRAERKRPKTCTCCRVSEAKFYLYHSIKIAKARPGFDDRPEHPSVQINSSSPWLN